MAPPSDPRGDAETGTPADRTDRLDGIDRNITPWRPDLAAAHLQDRLPAARYVPGTVRQAVRGIVPMRAQPDFQLGQTSELLYGETLTVYEDQDGWAWGQCGHDGYVGYVRADALTDRVRAPTHRVAALRAFVFPAPSFKTPPLRAATLGAQVTVEEEADGPGGPYARIAPEGWIAARLLRPAAERVADPVEVALRFLEVPYLWGGRSGIGLDCSGLVQIALAEAGLAVPRDTYLQVRDVGRPVAEGPAAEAAVRDGQARRGDLAFFPGHVGLMVDGTHLLHANVHRMAVTMDPVVEVAARVRAQEGCGQDGHGLTALRRLALPVA